MKKRELPFHIIMTAVCGWTVQNAYAVSDAAAWSLVISSVNNSPFQLVKPYALVFIMWTFIELSCMRPHLLHYVSVRITALVIFVGLSVLLLYISGKYAAVEPVRTVIIILTMIFAEMTEYLLYRSSVRAEIFFVPLMVCFGVIFAVLLFCSFYPPPWGIFCDRTGSL